jgi:peptide/nickel transport system ATP-binding protein
MTAVPALEVRDLSVEFRTRGGVVRALEHVGFAVGKGETVALVGESGSGKSVTAYAVMGILDPAGKVTAGRAMFGGLDLLQQPEKELAELRGRDLSMIFQSPRTALNPIRRVGEQLADVLVRHGGATRAGARTQAIDMLKKVRIPDPERRAMAYPFELSGGMCQRVMIALALACRPAVLIADEPTANLDAEAAARVLDIFVAFRQVGVTVLIATHDLALVERYAGRILKLEQGRIA